MINELDVIFDHKEKVDENTQVWKSTFLHEKITVRFESGAIKSVFWDKGGKISVLISNYYTEKIELTEEYEDRTKERLYSSYISALQEKRELYGG